MSSSNSRGKFILSLLNSNTNTRMEYTEEDNVSKQSSPAPSLTELTALDPDFVTDFITEESSGKNDNLEQPTGKLFQVHPVSVDYQLNVSSKHNNFDYDEASVLLELSAQNCILKKGSVDQTLRSEEVIFQDTHGFEEEESLNLENQLFQDIEIDDPDDPTFIPGDESESESSSIGSCTQPLHLPPSEVLLKPDPLVPYSSSDSDSNDDSEALNNKKGKKRVKNEKNWKKNIRRKNRLSGKKYVNTKKVVVNEKTMKPPCVAKFRLKCNHRFTEEQRLKIHSEYWNAERTWDSKRQFVISCIKKTPIARQQQRDGSRKSKTESHKYCFYLNHKEELVCKTFFLNTLAISESFVRVALKKSGECGMVTSDLRGKHLPANKIPSESLDRIKNHISKFPVYQSHYSRERTKRGYLGNHLNISIMYTMYVEECASENVKPEKKWVYSKMFNEEFNLSFHQPDNDTCDVCDRLDCLIKSEKNDDKLNDLKIEKDNHLKDASQRYKLKREDKEKGRSTEGLRVIMSDLQKCLPTPDLKNSQSFYSRKLWTLNSTIYDATTDKTSCMVWDETVAGRGGNEIASCLFTWANEELKSCDPPVKQLTVWTDNCSGQNRNINMIMMYFWLLEKLPELEEVNHKFLLAGHTHMEVDGKHSVIERAKKQIKKHTIFTTNDWVNFIASCSKKNPFIVRRMGLEDFLDFLFLMKKDGPFISRKKDTDNESFLISNAVWLQFRKGDRNLYFKNSFTDQTFKSVDLRRKRRELNTILPAEIPPIRTTKRNISDKKYRDLMNLLQWIPEEYKSFFESLPHGENGGDFPEDDSTAHDP